MALRSNSWLRQSKTGHAIARWKTALGDDGSFKVGIAWQGNRFNKGDRQRSIPLQQFAPLADVAGVRLISLQKGPAAEHVKSKGVTFRVEQLPGEWDSLKDRFIDAAAIMKSLNLIITADTAIGHLAVARCRSRMDCLVSCGGLARGC